MSGDRYVCIICDCVMDEDEDDFTVVSYIDPVVEELAICEKCGINIVGDRIDEIHRERHESKEQQE